jgi:enoyl-CoA hydratase/carnithine racemase
MTTAGGAPPLVRIENRDGCAWVTLDRPPLNLLVPELIAAIRDGFRGLAGNPRVRAAVLTGAGRATCAGMQLEVLRDLDAAGAKRLITLLHEAIRSIHEAPFPTVCMLNGACLGGGLEIAMACDMRVASSEARLGMPEVKVGVPSVIEAALLPALVGPGRAAELLLTGDNIGAAQALAWGLVNQVVAPADLEAATHTLLGRVLACAPGAIRLQKELIVAWRNTDLRSAIERGIGAFTQAYLTGEPGEGARAFLEKRPPRFA